MPGMKTTHTNCWIDLAALGPEDEDAELRSFVRVDVDDQDIEVTELALRRWRALAVPVMVNDLQCE